jgi:hypothetical protein
MNTLIFIIIFIYLFLQQLRRLATNGRRLGAGREISAGTFRYERQPA